MYNICNQYVREISKVPFIHLNQPRTSHTNNPAQS